MQAAGTVKRAPKPARVTKPGHSSFIIRLEVADSDPLPDDRSERRLAVTNQGRAAGSAFREIFGAEIASAGLTEQVSYIGEAMNLPFIVMVATSDVADWVRRLPGVISVIEDEATAGMFDPRSKLAAV